MHSSSSVRGWSFGRLLENVDTDYTCAHHAVSFHVSQGTTVCGSCVRLSWGKSGRADRDRERERAVEALGPIAGTIPPLSTAAAQAAAAGGARGAQFTGLYGHPPSYATGYNGSYPTNIFPQALYGSAYAAQHGGLPPATPPPAQLPGQAQQQQQQQQVRELLILPLGILCFQFGCFLWSEEFSPRNLFSNA